MKIELDIPVNSLFYLNELANEFEITPSEVVSGLLVKYCLDNITKDLKEEEKSLKHNIKP